MESKHSTAKRHGAALASALTVLSVFAGCGTVGGSGRNAVTEIHLFAAPTALNLDGQAGPDSIGVRVYASAAGAARGVPIQQGNLEILMFDGSVDETALRTAAPRKTWTFSATSLRPFATETSLGVGYQLALAWQEAPPKESVVTVVARHRGAGGRELYSASNTIFVANK